MLGSKLIRWGLKTDMAHFAIAFNDVCGDHSIIVESTMLKGVHPTWRRIFLKTHTIVKAIHVDIPPELEVALYDQIVSVIGGRKYDVKGVLFLAVMALWYKKILNKEIRGKNIWASQGDIYCSEVMHAISDFLIEHGVDLERYPKQMLTPDRAYEIIPKDGKVFKELHRWPES